jgi:hypothetical protein
MFAFLKWTANLNELETLLVASGSKLALACKGNHVFPVSTILINGMMPLSAT